jgi:hypothetical protein
MFKKYSVNYFIEYMICIQICLDTRSYDVSVNTVTRVHFPAGESSFFPSPQYYQFYNPLSPLSNGNLVHWLLFEAYYSCSCSAKVKNAWSYTATVALVSHASCCGTLLCTLLYFILYTRYENCRIFIIEECCGRLSSYGFSERYSSIDQDN